MKLVDKLKKAYDYKKELYKAEKGSSSKEYHIENADCQYLCKNLGFDFYKCMLEKIKEIESRTGFYDERLNRFVEKIGAYCEREAFDLAINDFKLTNVPNKYFLDKEGSDFWCIRIEDNNGDYEDYYIRKWYKADYKSYRL